MIRFSDLIFHTTESNGWDGEHIKTTLFISLIILVVFGVMSLTAYAMGSGVDRFIPATMMGVLGILAMIFVSPIISTLVVDKNEDYATNSSAVQTWAEEKYVLDLTDEQAESLFSQRSMYENGNYAQTGAQTMVDYYGENTLVSLIKYDKEWRLFSNDKELSQVGERK